MGGAFANPWDAAVRIYSRTHGDYVLYGKRDYGINLRWYSDEAEGHGYPPLPFPSQLRSPSGEPGQILLQGTATKLELFHGLSDDELDWHVYFKPDSLSRHRLFKHLMAHGKGADHARMLSPGFYRPLEERDLDELWTEWMVLDCYKNVSSSLTDWNGDELFYSADVTKVLGLVRTAWNCSLDAADDQGNGTNPDGSISEQAALVYLQGPLVNDQEHGFRVEIHPLDSIAYAFVPGGPITVPSTDPDWPRSELTWRVAAFTNSRFQRIGGAVYVQKERTTTWYLPLPKGANTTGSNVRVRATFPGFDNHSPVSGFTDRRVTPTDHYQQYGVASSDHAIEPDPRNGQMRLRVTIRMKEADRWGGMFLGEYALAVKP